MCGEIEADVALDDETFRRLVALAGRHGAAPTQGKPPAVSSLDDGAARRGYMDRLFRDGLTRAIDDAAGLPDGQRMDAIASQAIVFARLAGLLAGHLPPEADLFRSAVDAMLDGHGEPARAAADAHHHHHDHGHDHDRRG